MSTGTERPSETTVDRLRHEFEKLIETVWSQGERAADVMGLRTASRCWCPAVDIVEAGETVQVTLDVPGVDPQLVEIVLTGNMLTVKGERPGVSGGTSEIAHRRERATGAFQRAIPLPVPVDSSQVHASARNGVLVVTIAKLAPVKPREVRVDVQTPPSPSM